jgi:hypothetical protein
MELGKIPQRKAVRPTAGYCPPNLGRLGAIEGFRGLSQVILYIALSNTKSDCRILFSRVLRIE